MASSTNIWTTSLDAGADLSSSQYLGIVPTAGAAALAGAAVKILGVLQNEPASGQAASVMVVGRTKGISGAAIVAGVELEMNASAKFITLAAGESVGFATSAATGADEVIDLILK